MSPLTTNFKPKHFKQYPHFDKPICASKINAFLANSKNVANHQFLPFICYERTQRVFRKNNHKDNTETSKKKTRPIRYASHKDALIFTHYRQILAPKYEAELKRNAITDCPIAYRQLKKPNGHGKCNIDFAKDAFDEIQRQGDCFAIALDISSFFENLEHAKIKEMWKKLLKTNRLPDDHYTVFKAITQYAQVDQQAVYKRLNLSTTPHNQLPKQLCSPQDFRNKICGSKKNSNFNSLIQKNKKNFGIPQGSPISDLIANFYLLDFDCALHAYAQQKGGKYMRYSDDILLILPTNNTTIHHVEQFISTELRKSGPRLVVNPEKTIVVQYERSGKSSSSTCLKRPQNPEKKDTKQPPSGFEYLGFHFDGEFATIRPKTMSAFYRKVLSRTRSLARRNIKNNPSLTIDQILKKTNFIHLDKMFMRVLKENFNPQDYGTLTFYSYAKRAEKTFGSMGIKITKQLKKYKKLTRKRYEEYLKTSA